MKQYIKVFKNFFDGYNTETITMDGNDSKDINPFYPAWVRWGYYSEIKIAKTDETAQLPFRKNKKDAGLDFYSLRDYIIEPHEFKVVDTGITVEIPSGYFGLLKPKGSSPHLIGAGVVDEPYQGEIMFKVFNISNYRMVIRKYDPIGQMVIIPIISPRIEEVSLEEIHKEETERGATGGILNDKR